MSLVVALLSWGLGVPEWGHQMWSQGISRVTWKGKDRRILVMHVPLVMSASWGGGTYLTPMSLTNQPAVSIHVLVKLGWDGALTVDKTVMAGPGVFGTDMPYEAMGIHDHLDIYGMPVLPVTVDML